MIISRYKVKRKALIIYCTNTNSSPLTGTARDYDNVKSYLMSCCGGCWNEKEIKSLKDPTAQDIEICLKDEFRDIDYGFILFSGHGCIDGRSGVQNLEVKGGCIAIEGLYAKVPKLTIVIDACRTVSGLEQITETRFYSSTKEPIDEMTRIYHRITFNKYIRLSSVGKNIIFATSKGMPSVCRENGSVFINRLLVACEDFHKNKDGKEFLNTEEAIKSVGAIRVGINNKVEYLTPELSLPDGGSHFPIAVKKKPLISKIKYHSETRTFSSSY